MTGDDSIVMTNPYASYGNQVTGPDFVGRTDQIRSIRSRVFQSYGSASSSIVGPPRVGKSSLARELLDRYAVGRNPRGLTFLPLWITVMGRETEQSLFRELARSVQRWLERNAEADADRVKPSFDRLDGVVEWDDLAIYLGEYLREVRYCGYQVVAVLDEFDAAGKLFRRAAPFELLRTIAYDDKTRVALIVTSRREIGDIIVRSTPEVSNLHQIFGVPVQPGCFRPTELTALIARSPHESEEFRAAAFAWLSRETGGQPFLASAWLSQLHDTLADHSPEPAELDALFSAAERACASVTVHHHEQMLELLRDEGRLNTLLEVLFGPRVTVGPADADRLEKEGLIRRTSSGWAAFSETFQRYLTLLERKVDDWPLWQKTETGLRDALADALRAAYGDDWEIRVSEAQPRIGAECEKRRKQARVGLGEPAAGDTFLEWAFPKELLEIMTLHWVYVEPFFGRELPEWAERIELVASVRTPMAHNRRAAKTPREMEDFRTACREILEWLSIPAAGRPRPALR
ncbi:ATP-binding protein [Frankia nepalensis]|nr:ATP-binding protein [Frankia nepalensis]MBL7508535.1 ATP-binding protein [Frankia nepalensis]